MWLRFGGAQMFLRCTFPNRTWYTNRLNGAVFYTLDLARAPPLTDGTLIENGRAGEQCLLGMPFRGIGCLLIPVTGILAL